MKNTQKNPGQHGKPADSLDKGAKGQHTDASARMESKSDPSSRSAPAQHRQDEPGKMHAPERDRK